MYDVRNAATTVKVAHEDIKQENKETGIHEWKEKNKR